MKNNIHPQVFTENMTETIKNAVNEALLHHQAVGNKIAYWDKSKIVVEVPKVTQVHRINKFSDQSK